MAGKNKRLTELLTEMGSDPITNAAGDIVTRDEALAKVLWDLALGYAYKDDDNKEQFVAPDRSIAQFIFERREGKVATAAIDDRGVMTASDKVSELARNRINSHADEVLETDAEDAVPEHPGPMGVPTLGSAYTERPG